MAIRDTVGNPVERTDELRDALAKMEKSVYNQHVSVQKNDFANWVAAILGDAACAKELKTAKTPATAKTIS